MRGRVPSGGRGRGRDSGGYNFGGRGAGIANPAGATANSGSSVELCGTCGGACADDSIGCDRCSKWFHSSSMCLGLPDQLVSSIKQYGGDGIAFICTDCRITGGGGAGAGGGVSVDAFRQLHQTVKKLCETVQELTMQMKQAVSGGTGDRPSLPPGPPLIEGNRALIREEIREMEERKKRSLSIIIKGLDVSDPQDLSAAFNPIAVKLTGGSVSLLEVVCINLEDKMFRAKVSSVAVKKRLIDNAASLHGSEFSHVYVNRDLTYVQRRELKRRREQSHGRGQRPRGSDGANANVGDQRPDAQSSDGWDLTLQGASGVWRGGVMTRSQVGSTPARSTNLN